VRRDALAAGAAVVADGPLRIEAACAAHARERRDDPPRSAKATTDPDEMEVRVVALLMAEGLVPPE
jgi:hypothetical protein